MGHCKSPNVRLLVNQSPRNPEQHICSKKEKHLLVLREGGTFVTFFATCTLPLARCIHKPSRAVIKELLGH